MQIAKVGRRELEQLAHEEYRRAFPGRGRERAEMVNADEAAAIDAPVTFAFRGKPYTLEPIPFTAGIELHELMAQFHAPQSNAAYREACERAVEMFGRLAYRRGRKWLRWLLPNPFRNASEADIGRMLDFFFKCRTGTPYRIWLRRAVARARSTSSTGVTSSSASTVERRAPGVTTSTG